MSSYVDYVITLMWPFTDVGKEEGDSSHVTHLRTYCEDAEMALGKHLKDLLLSLPREKKKTMLAISEIHRSLFVKTLELNSKC